MSNSKVKLSMLFFDLAFLRRALIKALFWTSILIQSRKAQNVLNFWGYVFKNPGINFNGLSKMSSREFKLLDICSIPACLNLRSVLKQCNWRYWTAKSLNLASLFQDMINWNEQARVLFSGTHWQHDFLLKKCNHWKLSLLYLIAIVYLEMCNHLNGDINLLCTICSYILEIYTWIFENGVNRNIALC